MTAETSLDKALSVLEAVARSGGCRLMDLSSSVGYPPATIHRILSQLLRRGYVRQDPDTKAYRRKFIQVDIEPTQIGKILQPDLGLVSEIGEALKALISSPASSSGSTSRGTTCRCWTASLAPWTTAGRCRGCSCRTASPC